MSGETIFAILATLVLIVLFNRKSRTPILLAGGLVAAVSWLVVLFSLATDQWSGNIGPSTSDLKVPLFAIGVTLAWLWLFWLGGRKSVRAMALVLMAIWFAAVTGWWAGQWNGILAITMPSLIILLAGLLALPPFVLPVRPLPWKVPTLLAFLYTVLWWVAQQGGLIEMDAIGLLLYLQGFFLVFRFAFPLGNIRWAIVPFIVFVAYGVIVFSAWRGLQAFDLSSFNLLVLVQGLLTISAYTLPFHKASVKKPSLWLFLAGAFAYGYGLARISRVIDPALTNDLIFLLGFVALARLAMPTRDSAGRRFDVAQAVFIAVLYGSIWTVGLAEERLDPFSWFGAWAFVISAATIPIPVLIKPSDNWQAFQAIITYSLGKNYPYYSIGGSPTEPGSLIKRAAGNQHAKILAGPGIVLSGPDHTFVVYDGLGFDPERLAPPGLSFTYMFEEVQEAVDLRYQLRARPPVKVKTKDGIDVSVVTFTPFRLAAERAVAVTLDGRLAITAYHTGTLKLWNLATDEKLGSLPGHTDWARALAMMPDGQWAVSASSDDTIRVWNLSTGEATDVLEEGAKVRALAMAADGRRFISGHSDGSVKIWKLEEHPLIRPGEQIDGEAGTPRSSLRVWSLERTLDIHQDWVYAIAMARTGYRAVSASADGSLKVWDWQRGQEEYILTDQDGWIPAVAITPDGHKAVSASSDGRLKVWDLNHVRQERILSGRQRGVRAIAVPDKRRAIFISTDGSLKTWSLETGELLDVRQGSESWQRAVREPKPELGRSYPYDEEAIYKAVRAQRKEKREKGEKSGWDQVLRQRCKQVMRDIIAQYAMDELCGLYSPERDSRVEIAERMRDEVRSQVKKLGLELIGGGISNLVPPDEVIRQRIEHWQAHMQKRIMILRAEAEAEEKRKVKHAQAKAEKEVVMSIARVLEQLERLDSDSRRKLIALRLLAAIERSETDVEEESAPKADSEVEYGLRGLASRG